MRPESETKELHGSGVKEKGSAESHAWKEPTDPKEISQTGDNGVNWNHKQ